MRRRNIPSSKILTLFLLFSALSSAFFFSRSEIRGFDYLKLNRAQTVGSRIPASAELFPQVTIEETGDPAFKALYRIIDKENHVICYASKTDSAASMSCVKQ